MSGWDWALLLVFACLVFGGAGLNLCVAKANEITMKELRRIWDEMQEKP